MTKKKPREGRHFKRIINTYKINNTHNYLARIGGKANLTCEYLW